MTKSKTAVPALETTGITTSIGSAYKHKEDNINKKITLGAGICLLIFCTGKWDLKRWGCDLVIGTGKKQHKMRMVKS